MSKNEWDMLCNLPFGQIIFSTPESDKRIVLPQISGGDMDGNLYFVCWDKMLHESNQEE